MESISRAMVGRDRERRLLSEFVTAGSGRSLVLWGETGVGKSTLLDHAAESAEAGSHRVIRASGAEAEWELPFAGLHQFLHPLSSDVDRLDRSRSRALDVVFGRGEGTPSVMTLGIAVLDLLSLAASTRPLLLVLDDGQWLDTPSTGVLGFVGRRLSGSSVKLLAGVRSDVPCGFDTVALPRFAVDPLSSPASEQLLDLHHPGLAPGLRRLILDEAQGNPLALGELPPHVLGARPTLREGQVADNPDLPGYLGVPLPRRLQQVYGTRLEALDDTVRAELLRGALDGVAAGASARQHSPRRRYRMTNAKTAVDGGLLDLDLFSGELVFRHPLVRSTVVQTATPDERRAAHTDLARTHHEDPQRRALHLAASTAGPDEAAAAALEEAAESVTRRGGAVAAVAWLTRAAELSETSGERSRRLGAAAFVAGHAGLLERAQQLALSDTGGIAGESPAAVLASAYTAFYQDGNVRSARCQVRGALEGVRDSGGGTPAEVVARLVALLLAVDQYASDEVAWEDTHGLLASLGDLVPPLARIYQDAWGDVVRRGAGVRERVERAFGGVRTLEPWDLSRLAVAAYHVDGLGPFRPHLERAVEREVRTGAIVPAMTMLHLIMLDRMGCGQWDEAERTGRRILDLTGTHHHPLFAHHTRAYLGLLAAMRGHGDRARELQDTVDTWARPRGIGFLTQIADAIGSAAALAEGDDESAYLHAIGITEPGTFAAYSHQAPRTLLDLVEAALRTGRAAHARRHALAAHEAGLPAVSPRLALITFGALAMTSTDPAEAAEWYHRAERQPAANTFPFELARIRLARGVHLHSTQGPKAAQPVLADAADTFERIGASTWAVRARAELRTTLPSVPNDPQNLKPLTRQERRIADLAASGLSNKEIGARTHLSPRTVSSHLYRVFPKLGITSRAALRDALERLAATPDA
ncbi:LuxR family transcriptional regulator [Kitasatospora purpeofusca]|uniref:LuxR family transcriptional regulator n=1 Tax=Kitasatospora purpeofusca TaxID=67352 RepID=UPI0030F01ABE